MTASVTPPAACPTCDGSRVASLVWAGGNAWRPTPCPACCCEICGQPTDTPPVCLSCDADEDAAAVRRADR